MVRSGDVHVPVQALDDDVPLHLDELIVGVLVSDQLLNVLNGRLVHVLLVALAGQEYT